MRGRTKKYQDSEIIRCIVEWAQNTRDALRRGETLPASCKFVLTSFVHKLCSIHRQRMLFRGTRERPVCGKHHYLYTALRLTYEIQLTVKTPVSMLLREIFLCEGSLQAIFSMLFDPPCRPDISMHSHELYPSLQSSDRSAFSFFVSSICPLGRDGRERGKNIYTPNRILNWRFVARGELTTPLQAATNFGDPDLVLLLLRHGADPLVCYRGNSMDFPQKTPVGFTIDTLNISAMLRGSTWSQLSEAVDIFQHTGETIEKALLCLTYFSRAAFALNIRESSQTVDTSAKVADDSVKKVHFQVRPSVSRIIDLAAFRQPPSLRHACRCVIRDAVSRAGKSSIPEAIEQLPLPAVLTRFLDLRC